MFILKGKLLGQNHFNQQNVFFEHLHLVPPFCHKCFYAVLLCFKLCGAAKCLLYYRRLLSYMDFAVVCHFSAVSRNQVAKIQWFFSCLRAKIIFSYFFFFPPFFMLSFMFLGLFCVVVNDKWML